MESVGQKVLTTKRIEKLTASGRYPDGRVPGLYLKVTTGGSKSWMLRYKKREMGLGSLGRLPTPEVARQRALELWPVILSGGDPVAERQAARDKAAVGTTKAVSFAEWAATFVKEQAPGWKSHKEVRQWERAIERDVIPIAGHLPPSAFDTTIVLKILKQDHHGQPLWLATPTSAERLRGRIERILDAAKAAGLREGENPARWRGHLDKLMPKRKRFATAKHHASLPYSEVPQFLKELRGCEGVDARALELTTLTALRTSEVIGARKSEFDFTTKVWTVPAARMKASQEDHRVPLCNRAVEILRSLPQLTDNEFVFPGAHVGKHISDNQMLRLMQELRPGYTVHGLRASFRTWARERTNFPRELCEAMLGHTVEGRTERAYARGDLLEKRRKVSGAWAAFCLTPVRTGDVLPLRVAG